MYKKPKTLGLNLILLFKNPFFRFGFTIKVLAIIFFVPLMQSQYFTPFIVYNISDFSLDPWTNFLESGGNSKSFPYGIIMFLFHLPFVSLGFLLDNIFLNSNFSFTQLSFSSSLLFADVFLCTVLISISRTSNFKIIIFYWFSPIVIFITYWHGQTDLILVFFVMLSFYFLQEKRILLSSFILSLSLAVKLNSILIIPFIFLYLLKNKKYKDYVFDYILTFLLFSVLLQLPFLFNEGAQDMIFSSPEFNRVYELYFSFGETNKVFIVPILYALLVYVGWRIGSMNMPMLYSFTGASFFIILSFSPASVGWFIWITPFLVLFQQKATRDFKYLIFIYSIIFVSYNIFLSSGAYVNFLNLDLTMINFAFPERILSLILSMLSVTGLMISYTMFKQALVQNNYYNFSKKPFSISIAGDSGSGKDTLSKALLRLFGKNRTVEISGDDYHLFERDDMRWNLKTHLNPLTNNLHLFVENSLKLIRGEDILVKKYDHHKGKFQEHSSISSSDVILISGLHALFPIKLRKQLKLKIFLNMDEKLRYFLKLKRDVIERGYEEKKVITSLKKRQVDREKFINYQIKFADLIFTIKPSCNYKINLTMYKKESLPPLKLIITTNSYINYQSIQELLTSICQADVRIKFSEDTTDQIEMEIEGNNIQKEDIEHVARIMMPEINDILALKPEWSNGILGVMQLFVLLKISDQDGMV